MPLKVCARCSIAKPIEEFYPVRRITGARRSRGGFGVEAKCKRCKSEDRKPGLQTEREAKADLLSRGMKTCGKCGNVKPFNDFHKMVASPNGVAFKCKPCVNEDSEKWRQDNPSAHKQWYQENKEHKATYFLNWRAKNAEAEAARIARWAKANPAKVNALVAKRNAAKLKAVPAWADQSAIEQIYAEATKRTKETGERHEVDHIVPLQGKIVCGLHWAGNLQVLPKAQNISKHNRRWPYMPC